MNTQEYLEMSRRMAIKRNKMNKFIEEGRERIKAKVDEISRIARLAKEAYKNVTKGKSTNESNFILGFIAGYKQKEKENNGD